MTGAPHPPDEEDRIAALRSFGVLDTPPSEAFDNLTQLAARRCATPMALISLVDRRRQWFKSRTGIDRRETPREQAICGFTILKREPLVVPDTLADERLRENPLCTGAPNIRFYTGVPLISREGAALGTLCVLDTNPRDGISAEALQDLVLLAGTAVSLLENERAMFRQSVALRESVHRAKNLLAMASALARRTLGTAASATEAQDKIAARFGALGRAQDVLLRQQDEAIALPTLVRDNLSSVLGDEWGQVEIAGPDVEIIDGAVEGLSLALYELATNALKYGALSVPGGRVTLTWERQSPSGPLQLVWRETGGPDPGKPERKGFGSMVLSSLSEQKLGGEARLELNGDGAVWRAEVSADQVRP